MAHINKKVAVALFRVTMVTFAWVMNLDTWLFTIAF